MKFAHLGDLHLGMTMHHVNLIEDQKYILDSILKVLKEEKADGVAAPLASGYNNLMYNLKTKVWKKLHTGATSVERSCEKHGSL